MSKARLVITAVNVEKRPVSEVARSYGVARSWVYTLLARYAAVGEAAIEPRSRRPETSPRAIPDATVSLIIELRKDLAGQRLDAGPQTIAWHLEHHHQVKVSAATVSRYLTRAGWSAPSRASARSPPTSGSRPSCRTSAGRPTSRITRSPAGPAPRS
jgi:transposase